jgi:hypothetical protein
MDDAENNRRMERLIAAMEAQANAVNRLVQALTHKQAKSVEQKRAAPLRRVPLDAPIVVTPIVEAAVKRALAKARRQSP